MYSITNQIKSIMNIVSTLNRKTELEIEQALAKSALRLANVEIISLISLMTIVISFGALALYALGM